MSVVTAKIVRRILSSVAVTALHDEIECSRRLV
jgi:hypothetical protein